VQQRLGRIQGIMETLWVVGGEGNLVGYHSSFLNPWECGLDAKHDEYSTRLSNDHPACLAG
jgi:hypothetical protein